MTQEQKISYALGANVGESFKTNGITIDFNAFKDGFLAGMEGKNQFTSDQMNAIFQELKLFLQYFQIYLLNPFP